MEGSRSETEDGKDGLNISYFTSRKSIEIVMKLSCEENVSFTCPTWRDTWNELDVSTWRGVRRGSGLQTRAEYLLLIEVLFAREHITYVSLRPLSWSFSLFFGVRATAIAENGGTSCRRVYERVEKNYAVPARKGSFMYRRKRRYSV